MNKFKLSLFILMYILVISLSTAYANISPYTLLGYTIYLDPGHGGLDGGATYKNISEKDINLTISQKLKTILENYGATVYMTRNTDCDLSTTTTNRKRSDLANRAYLINSSSADIYISLHTNYINNSTWRGLQIFYNDKQKNNKTIAESLTTYLKTVLLNVRTPEKNNTYYMYKRINKPGVLIEMGFLSNPADRYQLTNDTEQDTLALNLAKSIEYYLNS